MALQFSNEGLNFPDTQNDLDLYQSRVRVKRKDDGTNFVFRTCRADEQPHALGLLFNTEGAHNSYHFQGVEDFLAHLNDHCRNGSRAGRKKQSNGDVRTAVKMCIKLTMYLPEITTEITIIIIIIKYKVNHLAFHKTCNIRHAAR